MRMQALDSPATQAQVQFFSMQQALTTSQAASALENKALIAQARASDNDAVAAQAQAEEARAVCTALEAQLAALQSELQKGQVLDQSVAMRALQLRLVEIEADRAAVLQSQVRARVCNAV